MMAYGNKCRGNSWASYGAAYSIRRDGQVFYHRIPPHSKPYADLSNAIGWVSIGVVMVVSIWVYGSAHRGVRLPLRSLKWCQICIPFTNNLPVSGIHANEIPQGIMVFTGLT